MHVSHYFNSELVRRLASAALLVPLALLAAYLGSGTFLCLVAVAGILVSLEWSRLTAPSAPIGAFMLPAGAVVAGLAAFALCGAVAAIATLSVSILIAALVCSAIGLRSDWCVIGISYAGFSALALVILRGDGSFGLMAICWLLALVWISDSAAFAVGRLIGGARLAPRISPAKTWSGAIAAVLGAGVVGLLTAKFVADTSASGLVIASMGVGIAAVLGDLAESWIKRQFGAKNAGALIPGHGGVMDRVDSLIFAALAAAALGTSRAGLEHAGRGALIW